ncbi:DUF1800 domain-containing protein [Sulfurovum mangrovi]|uniref:DUF1800 domain-containing protein n=1 Tax=Sulfurovum mangrovi TaxID=2893889 RepID=UPI001E648CA1|nr:DUF1800 family protein [Sulfurovum mangrovi]UFH58970.1 DUF1800 domain-containing protein [Sulfurovum mangrovi]
MHSYIPKLLLAIFSLITFIGCSGSGSDTDTGSGQENNITLQIPVESREGAAHFLAHATFGAREEDIDRLYEMGGYIVWLNEQFQKPPTGYIEWIRKHQGINLGSEDVAAILGDAWYSIAVNAEDQLRQRVALALSEIIVVSTIGVESPYSVVDFYDLLSEYAFSNYRDILYHTALHPAMGVYLSTLGNMKEHTTEDGTLVHADENYAREILQLFSIGLVQLELNGEPKLPDGRPVPTYTQKDIEEFAKVYTGWTSDNGGFYYLDGYTTLDSLSKPMIPYEENHDRREKVFSDTFSNAYGEPQSIPAGLSAEEDLKHAIDIIMNHPNVGPFIGKQLIQRLVTSNPSPAYVARVASKFNDNGSGVKGDMKAVITAILTDEEALLKFKDQRPAPNSYGKLREQLIRIASVMRTFHAKGDPSIGSYAFYDFQAAGSRGLHLQPLTAPSVFNYFQPTFTPSGSLQYSGLVAPEFKVLPPLKMSEFGTVMLNVIGLTNDLPDQIRLDLSRERSLLDIQGPEALVEHLDLLLMSGQMSDVLKDELTDYAATHQSAHDIVGQVIVLIVLSAEYAIER